MIQEGKLMLNVLVLMPPLTPMMYAWIAKRIHCKN